MSGEHSLLEPDRFFGIRFESIGGLGAHAAGQILATAAVLRMGLNGAQFSSYGSEKKGSIVRSYIRLGRPEIPIRTSAPIDSPDVIVVFHGALMAQPITLAGLRAAGTFIFPAEEGVFPDALSQLPSTAKVIRVDALRIAMEEKSRPNAVLLGTLSTAVPFMDSDIILAALNDEFAHRHPEAVASNERAFLRGAEEFEEISGVGKQTGDLPISRPGPIWGYETAPIGGVLPRPGNSVWNDLSTFRTGWIPVLDKDKCVHCGLCDMVCPDFCLAWSTGDNGDVRLQGVDYRYCKGCFRCVETCPSEAMTREIETPSLANRLRVPLFDLNEGAADGRR